MGEGTRIESVTELERFRELRGAWQDLLAGSPRPTLFQSHAFLAAAWRTAPGRPLVVTASRGGRLVAALPLRIRGRRAQLLAEGSDMDALLRRDEPPETLQAVVDAARARFGYLQCFAIRAGVLASAVDASLLPAGRLNLLDMPDGWQPVYESAFTARRRQEHRRLLRRLGDDGEVRFDLARTKDELRRALGEVTRLHALRWAGRHDQARLASPESRRFHEALVEELEPEDGHTIDLLRCGGRAVAFSWYSLVGETMTGYRMAFDPAFARSCVGVLVLLHSLETAAGDGASVANFLRGGEAYKDRLCNRFEPLVGGTCLARGAAARAEAAAFDARHHAWLALRGIGPLKRAYHRYVAWRNVREGAAPAAAPRPSG